MSDPATNAMAPAEVPEAEDPEVAAAAEDDVDFIPSVFEQYETDEAAEENGKWFNNLRPGINMRLRRGTSRAAMKARAKVLQRFRKLAVNGEFPAKVQDQIFNHIMAEGIIVNWSGEAMRYPDGKPLPYSKPAAVMLLAKARGLREELSGVVSDMDNFRIEQREADEGN